MPVFRIEKNTDYTTVSNHHLRDKNLSLKSIGLLTIMLSLPDDWDYSLEGLTMITKDGLASVRTAIKELEDNQYLVRNQTRNERGKFGDIEYLVYETPICEKPISVKPKTEKPISENRTEINTNITKELNNKILNNKKKNIKKKKYGEYQNVLLTDEEIQTLKSSYNNWQDLITYLDEYIEMKGYKAKSHYLCIKKWVVNAVADQRRKKVQISKGVPDWFNQKNEATQTTREETEELEKILNEIGGSNVS